MNRKLLGLMFAGGNAGVSAAMSILIAFVPFAYEGVDPGVVGRDGQPVIISLSAIDVNGPQIVLLLFAHTLAAFYFFYLIGRDQSKLMAPRLIFIAFAVGFIAYASITFNSFGPFYIPSAVLSILAALTVPVPKSAPVERLPSSPPTRSPKRRDRRRGKG